MDGLIEDESEVFYPLSSAVEVVVELELHKIRTYVRSSKQYVVGPVVRTENRGKYIWKYTR
jgi:hypothetical protein